MDFTDISIKWKTGIPIAIVIVIGIAVTVVVTGVRTRSIVMQEVEASTMGGYRDTVLNALTTLMISGDYAAQKRPFLEQMTHIADVRVVRAPALDKQFPRGPAGDYPRDEAEREVIETGEARVALEGEGLRGVYPYVARRDVMGKNCLTCHEVTEGAVLGAVSIRVPLGASFERIRGLQRLYIILGAFGMCFFVLVLTVVFRHTHRSLHELLAHVREVINKNLRVEILHKGQRDEVMVLSSSVDRMIDVFNQSLDTIVSSTTDISSAVDIISDMADRTSQGAQTQSHQATQIARVAEDMTGTILDISRNASGAAELSTQAMKTAGEGKQVADVSMEKITAVFQATVNLASMIEKLNGRVREIGDVVVVIKDVADQTNLLALNAAIEAARAGEQGRGFSVVADEVRKLAERTIRATEDVAAKIGAVQAESTETMRSMEAASTEVTATTEHIKRLGQSLTKIVDTIRTVSDRVTGIASAVEQQSSATEQVAASIETTADIAREIEHVSLAVDREVKKLAGVIEGLRRYTAEFRTRNAELMILDLAKKDHIAWINKVASHVDGDTTLDPSKLSNHKVCRLGKWYYAEGMKSCGSLQSFKALESPHKRVHDLGKQIVIEHDSGNAQRVQMLFHDLKSVSEEIVTLLDRIGHDYEESIAKSSKPRE
jgi:methyl-accepting chemotaxis protein